jgi:hypothetical protein
MEAYLLRRPKTVESQSNAAWEHAFNPEVGWRI